MGETTTPARPTTPPQTSRSRRVHITLWVLQVILALQFLGAGIGKLAGTHSMVKMFTDIGAGQWLRYFTGTLELAGAIGLVLPFLCGLASLGLSAQMLGATLTNIFILHDSFWLPLTILIGCVLVAWGRWPETKALVARFTRPAAHPPTRS